MGVNHFGVYLLTRLLVPQLTQGAEKLKIPSRVVVVASEAHEFSDLFDFENIDRNGISTTWEAFAVYGQSKLSNIFFARELATQFKAKNLPITANSLHPGFIRTDLARETKGILRALYEIFSNLLAMDSWDGAQNSIHLAVAPELVSTTGEYFTHFKTHPPQLGPYHKIIQTLLWNISADKTALSVYL